MKTTAPALMKSRHAAQTLTLDMDLPPASVRRARKTSVPEALTFVPEAPIAAAPPAVQAKPIMKKAAVKMPLPAVVKPKATGKTKASAPAPPAGRAERELALEGGRLWRMSGRHAVAYVQNASLACALLAVETKQLARHAMAVYYDKKGRAIAWQVRFDTQQWDEVMRRLG